MKTLLVLITLVFSFSALSETCDFEKGLSKGQRKALKGARRIDRIGPNRALLGKDVYKVDILETPDGNGFLVLLGEAHIKGFRSSLTGRRLIKRFPLRMLEGIPREEALYVARHLPELHKAIGWQRTLMRILTFNFFGSSISKAGKQGLTFLPGYDLVLFNKDKLFKARTGTVENVLSALDNVELESGFDINLPLEVGEFIRPSRSDNYIIHERNRRMADNIQAYLTSGKFDLPGLIMLGMNHNPGISRILETMGYKYCNNIQDL